MASFVSTLAAVFAELLDILDVAVFMHPVQLFEGRGSWSDLLNLVDHAGYMDEVVEPAFAFFALKVWTMLEALLCVAWHARVMPHVQFMEQVPGRCAHVCEVLPRDASQITSRVGLEEVKAVSSTIS